MLRWLGVGLFVGLLLLAGCGGGSSSAPTPSTTASSVVSVTATRAPTARPTLRATEPATPTDSPVVTPVGEPCTTDQLEAVFIGTQGFAGTADGKFEIRNLSAEICYLTGYVSIDALDAQGGDIDVVSYPEPGKVAPIVVLPPDTDPIPSVDAALTHFADGHAFVDALWHHCEITDPLPARWLVTMPGQDVPLSVDGHTPFGDGARVCAFSLRVYPLHAGLLFEP